MLRDIELEAGRKCGIQCVDLYYKGDIVIVCPAFFCPLLVLLSELLMVHAQIIIEGNPDFL